MSDAQQQVQRVLDASEVPAEAPRPNQAEEPMKSDPHPDRTQEVTSAELLPDADRVGRRRRPGDHG